MPRVRLAVVGAAVVLALGGGVARAATSNFFQTPSKNIG
jgi:hypothetical protein